MLRFIDTGAIKTLKGCIDIGVAGYFLLHIKTLALLRYHDKILFRAFLSSKRNLLTAFQISRGGTGFLHVLHSHTKKYF